MKFPGVESHIVKMDYNVPYEIVLNEEHDISVSVVFLDANHIVGSSMILFKGYFGTVLYTGDMRYHDSILEKNSFLFNSNGTIKYPIDELILDNTYCDPVFTFPAQVRSLGTMY